MPYLARFFELGYQHTGLPNAALVERSMSNTAIEPLGAETPPTKCRRSEVSVGAWIERKASVVGFVRGYDAMREYEYE